LSCYRKRQFIGNYTEIVSGRIVVVVVGGGLKEDGWKPDSFFVDNIVYIVYLLSSLMV